MNWHFFDCTACFIFGWIMGRAMGELFGRKIKMKKEYHGHKLRYPGFLCGDERVTVIQGPLKKYFKGFDPMILTRQLLRALAPQGCVERDIGMAFEDWEVVRDPNKILSERGLTVYRIKLTADGEVPEVEEAESLIDWPCQDLHGGKMPFLNCDENGRCKHPECHPSNNDQPQSPVEKLIAEGE